MELQGTPKSQYHLEIEQSWKTYNSQLQNLQNYNNQNCVGDIEIDILIDRMEFRI